MYDYKYRVLADGGIYEDNPLITDEITPLVQKNDDDVYFRDLIYIAEQTNKNEVYSLPNIYKEYSSVEDEYIVL